MAEPGNGVPAGRRRPRPGRLAAAFGRFWWEFLIGDTPELFVGAVGVVGLVALIGLDHSLRTASAAVLPVLVAGVLAASVGKAGRRPPS